MPRLQSRPAGAMEPADQLPNGIPTASARTAGCFRERAAIRHGQQGLGSRDVCRWLIVAPTDGEQALPCLGRARAKRLVGVASPRSLHCYESSDRGVEYRLFSLAINLPNDPLVQIRMQAKNCGSKSSEDTNISVSHVVSAPLNVDVCDSIVGGEMSRA
jgi:hypothetical protein